MITTTLLDAITNLESWVTEYGQTDGWTEDARWYENERSNVVALGDVPETRALSAIACLSGNQGWKGNVTAYRKLIAAWHAGLAYDGMPEDELRSLHIGLTVNVRKAIRALSQDVAIDTGKSARKMKSFECNLAGCEHDGPRCVTVDRWAYCAARGHRHHTEPKVGRNSCGIVPQGTEYETIAQAYRIVAERHGMTPDALQAAVWCIIAGYRKVTA